MGGLFAGVPPDAQNPTGEATAPLHVDLTGLPESAAQIFGRERELAALDEAWRDPATKIAVIVAMGGAPGGATRGITLFFGNIDAHKRLLRTHIKTSSQPCEARRGSCPRQLFGMQGCRDAGPTRAQAFRRGSPPCGRSGFSLA